MRRARRAVAWVVSAALAGGCASSVTLATPPQAKQVPAGLATPLRAQPASFGGAPCMREAVVRYLEAPGGLVLAADRSAADLVLSGNVTRVEVHSNRGDKEVSLFYFSAFIITAPIAAVMYGVKEWRADAAADGDLVAADANGSIVWRKAVTVSVSETQTTMPTDEALRTAMTQAVCQKLAATLLNGLADHLATARGATR
jgi:hypothetical protein